MDELIDQIMHEGDFHPSEEVVSARTLASYIGVTEAYFCRIKKEFL